MTTLTPTRGEIWEVNLDPVEGAEMNKTRPAVVISAHAFDHLPVRVIVPLTTWQPKFTSQPNKISVPLTSRNGLSTDSAADILHVRSVSLKRFESRRGMLDAVILEEIAAGVAVVIDYQP